MTDADLGEKAGLSIPGLVIALGMTLLPWD